MSVVVCDGCGRVAGEREAWCGACGRPLPGRTPPAEDSEAAPPGWLVAPTARDQEGPWFEPLPAVAVPAAEQAPVQPRGVPAYRVAEESRRAEARPAPAPLPPPLPVAGLAGGDPAGTVVSVRVPALRALLVPLVVVALASSAAAVALLVLHLLRDR